MVILALEFLSRKHPVLEDDRHGLSLDQVILIVEFIGYRGINDIVEIL